MQQDSQTAFLHKGHVVDMIQLDFKQNISHNAIWEISREDRDCIRTARRVKNSSKQWWKEKSLRMEGKLLLEFLRDGS